MVDTARRMDGKRAERPDDLDKESQVPRDNVPGSEDVSPGAQAVEEQEREQKPEKKRSTIQIFLIMSALCVCASFSMHYSLRDA
jgi:hypothetical protein